MFLQNRYYEAKVFGFPIINQIKCLHTLVIARRHWTKYASLSRHY